MLLNLFYWVGFDTGLDTLLGFDTPSQGYSTQVAPLLDPRRYSTQGFMNGQDCCPFYMLP